MKKLLFILVLIVINSILKAQDTPSVYKIHFITSNDLIYPMSSELTGIFISGKDSSKRELHFEDGYRFEEHIHFGHDSLVIIPGKYNYDPGGWLNLKNVESQVYKMALLRFHQYLFLVDSNKVKKFENEFEFAAGKFKYSRLKSFQPDPNLFKACAELSEKYFMKKIEDP